MTATTETQTFRAIWPIVDGQPRGYITEAAKIPGSGGTGHVVVIEAPAIRAPHRAYWRPTS